MADTRTHQIMKTTCFRRIVPAISVLFAMACGARAQFVPGSGGSVPVVVPFTANPNEFGGLRVYKTDRENDIFGGGTRAMLDLSFPTPASLGATGFRLQRSPGATSTWEDHPWGGGVLETTSADQDNFSFSPDDSYSYRLVANGGPHHGHVSNVVFAPKSNVNTRFAGWNLDESMNISGVMWPWLGRGLTASFTVRKLSDDSDVAGGITLQWYRVNPVTWAMTPIGGATGATYITTAADVGGYYLLCRATGNGVAVGGFVQVMSSGGVKIPNKAFVSLVASNGFRLNLFKSVPSLKPSDLTLSYWNGSANVDVPVTAVTAVGNKAVYQISAAIPAGAGNLSLQNESDVWNLGEEMVQGHFMPSVRVTVPAGGFQPEIVVEQPAGSGLVDGKAKRAFGTVKVGRVSAAKVFTIRNSGGAALSGLAVSKNGTHARDFITTAPLKTRLLPGESTTFKVTFKPGAKGTRNAAVHIKSNDANEDPFDIAVSGLGS